MRLRIRVEWVSSVKFCTRAICCACINGHAGWTSPCSSRSASEGSSVITGSIMHMACRKIHSDRAPRFGCMITMQTKDTQRQEHKGRCVETISAKDVRDGTDCNANAPASGRCGYPQEALGSPERPGRAGETPESPARWESASPLESGVSNMVGRASHAMTEGSINAEMGGSRREEGHGLTLTLTLTVILT